MSKMSLITEVSARTMLITCDDWMTRENVNDFLTFVTEHKDFQSDYHRILDLRGSSIDLNVDDMESILTSELGKRFNPEKCTYKAAYIVCDDTEKAFIELFTNLRKRIFDAGKPGKVFFSLEEAQEWISDNEQW